MKKYFAFDFETTGIDTTQDEPVEIAYAVVPEEGPYRVTSFLVATKRPITMEALGVHGITDEECSGGLHPELACWIIFDILLNNKIDGIIAFNGFKFDIPMLKSMIRRHLDIEASGNWEKILSRLSIEDPAIWYLAEKVFHYPRPVDNMEMDFISRLRIPYGTRFNLAKLCGEHGIEIQNAHSAEGDLRATIDLWRKMRA